MKQAIFSLVNFELWVDVALGFIAVSQLLSVIR